MTAHLHNLSSYMNSNILAMPPVIMASALIRLATSILVRDFQPKLYRLANVDHCLSLRLTFAPAAWQSGAGNRNSLLRLDENHWILHRKSVVRKQTKFKAELCLSYGHWLAHPPAIGESTGCSKMRKTLAAEYVSRPGATN